MPKESHDIIELVDPCKRCIYAFRLGAQTTDGASHKAKRTLAADEHMLEIIARVVLQHLIHR